MNEPTIAIEYDDRGARAAHSVLLELGQVLGAHRDAMVVIGGSVPALLLPRADLVDKLQRSGYERDVQGLKPFQLRRAVELRDGGDPVSVMVDLLMPRGARTSRHRPQLVQGLRVQEADGGEVALRHNLTIQISGTMPTDGRTRWKCWSRRFQRCSS